jgi:hypothetical protein
MEHSEIVWQVTGEHLNEVVPIILGDHPHELEAGHKTRGCGFDFEPVVVASRSDDPGKQPVLPWRHDAAHGKVGRRDLRGVHIAIEHLDARVGPFERLRFRPTEAERPGNGLCPTVVHDRDPDLHLTALPRVEGREPQRPRDVLNREVSEIIPNNDCPSSTASAIGRQFVWPSFCASSDQMFSRLGVGVADGDRRGKTAHLHSSFALVDVDRVDAAGGVDDDAFGYYDRVSEGGRIIISLLKTATEVMGIVG